MKRLLPIKSLSFWTLIGLFLVIISLLLLNPTPLPLSWDTMGYHAYLVELFVDGDLKIADLSFYQNILETYDNTGSLYQFVPSNTGGFITKYSAGWSVLNAPFEYIGHLFAGWFDYPQDGFSQPYQLASYFSSLFYTLLGLLFLRLALLTQFTEKITSLLLIILVLGTNYLHMNYSCIAVAHVYIFTFYAILLWLTIKFHENPNTIKAIAIGLCLGILILIRPTEILAAIIPLMFGINSFKNLKARIIVVFTTWHYYFAVLTMLGVYLIQIMYWKHTTGEYFFYSYTNSAEGLDFNRPYLLEVLFSFRKGWFIYTPIMLLIFVGLVKLYKEKRDWFWPLTIFFILNLYVVSCWTVWWYTGSFSQRALEHSYPIYIMIIGFAFVGLKPILKKILLSFVGICIILNLFQTWQIQNGILHFSNMSSEYYFSVFGQTSKPTPEQQKLLLIDRSLTEFVNEEDYILIQTFKGSFDLPDTLSELNPYTPLIEAPYDQLTKKDHVWIKAFAEFENLSDSLNDSQEFAHHLCVSMRYNGINYAWRNKTISRFESDIQTLEFEYLTPDLRTTNDTLSVGLWHQFGPPIKVRKLYFEVYERK